MKKLTLLATLAALAGCAAPSDQIRHDGKVTNTSRVLGHPVNGGVLKERWPNITVTWRFECAPEGCGRLLPGRVTLKCDRHNPFLSNDGPGSWQPQILKNCRVIEP